MQPENEKKMKNFLDRLNALIKTEGSVRAFALKCDIPQQSMNRFVKENAIPKIDAIIKICKTCNVSSDWLLGLSETRNPIMGIPNVSTPLINLPGIKNHVRQFKKKIEAGVEQANLFLKTLDEIERGL